MEDILFEWLINHRLQGFRVTRPVIQENEIELSNVEDFKAIDGWCSNFMQRFRLIRPALCPNSNKAAVFN